MGCLSRNQTPLQSMWLCNRNSGITLSIAIEDVVDMHYLTLQLVSRNSYERLSENIHGATRPRINITQLRNLGVCVCPLLEQREIVRRVEAMFKLADAVEKRVEAAKVRAEKLTQATLAKAFRGELVSTEAELARPKGDPTNLLLNS